MELENEIFNRILKHLALKNPLAFKNKGLDQLKKSISVLHYDYLIGASKELGIMLQKYPNKENEINNLFDFLMHFYNKRTKTHHMLFYGYIFLKRLDFNPKNAFDNTLKLERTIFFKTIQKNAWTH
ncbi:hypothetical protein AOH359_03910 [Helicobacter pylori]